MGELSLVRDTGEGFSEIVFDLYLEILLEFKQVAVVDSRRHFHGISVET